MLVYHLRIESNLRRVHIAFENTIDPLAELCVRVLVATAVAEDVLFRAVVCEVNVLLLAAVVAMVLGIGIVLEVVMNFGLAPLLFGIDFHLTEQAALAHCAVYCEVQLLGHEEQLGTFLVVVCSDFDEAGAL